MAEKKASQIVNEACLVDCEEGGNVNVTIHGNLTIIAGGDSNVADTEMGKTVASAHESKDEIRQSQESIDMQSDSREEGRVRSDKSGPQTKDKYRKLCNVVNKNTLDSVAVKIIEDYDDEKLSEPEFQVHPQMRRVKDFFKGGYEELEDEEFLEEWSVSEIEPRPTKRVAKNQMRKEWGFHYKENKDEAITKDELVKSIKKPTPKGNAPVTAIVASAGSGKTTEIRRITKQTLDSCPIFDYEDKSTTVDNNHGQPATEEQSHFKMVYYAEFKNIGYEEKLKPSKLLFGGLYKNESEEHEAYEWLLEHQSEAILFFDGLDQATWSIDESSERKMKPYEKGTVSEIMYNLLSRNLLPRVKIVFTSREFKVSELPKKSRPGEIISLIGLTRHDAEKLFVALVKDAGAGMWDRLKKLSPTLLNLVSIPVFLVLTAVIMASDPESPPPTTVTELYKRILLCLPRVENIQERNKINEVIQKLKGMAYQGMIEGRVVFHKSDLEKFELTIQDVRDLMIKVPGNNILSRYLLEGDFIFFFCHQSLQEFFCASFVAEMEGDQFLRFNDKQLFKPRWSVVLTFVSGILHDKDKPELCQGYKRRVFCRQIRSRCEKEKRAVGLLTAIYESNNDDLIQSLPRLPVVRDTRFGPDGAHMFSSIWARRADEKKEEKVDLEDCGLNDELLDIMVQNLKDRKIRVGNLDLIWNWDDRLTAKGLKPFLAIFKADEIGIDFEHLKYFRYEDFEWNNITKISWGYFAISMTNKGERIEIGGNVDGYFDKTTRVFETETHLESPSVFHVQWPIIQAALSTFFHQKAPPVAFEYQTHVRAHDLSKLDDLSDMKILNVDWKIPTMLLDCTQKKNVDSSLIEFCVEKFQVSFLDLVVGKETSFVPSNFLTEIESHIGINVNVHWWYRVDNSDDVTELIPIVQQNQVENLRLRIIMKGSSFDDIKRVIENCKVKKLTLAYKNKDDKSRMQHDKIVKLGEQHSIEVDGVTKNDEDDTAWWWILD